MNVSVWLSAYNFQVECSSMADMAKEIVKQNGFSDGSVNLSGHNFIKSCNISPLYGLIGCPYHPSFFSYNCSKGKDWRDWASGCSSRCHYFWVDGVFSCIWKYVKHCALRSWQVASKFKFHYVAYLWSNIIIPKLQVCCTRDSVIVIWFVTPYLQVKDGLVLPDKASLHLTAIEDADYKEDKIECELNFNCHGFDWLNNLDICAHFCSVVFNLVFFCIFSWCNSLE